MEVVIISIPTIASLNELFTTLPKDVIIVDTANYYPFRDGDIEELKNAFNNLLAHTLEYGGKSEGAEG